MQSNQRPYKTKDIQKAYDILSSSNILIDEWCRKSTVSLLKNHRIKITDQSLFGTNDITQAKFSNYRGANVLTLIEV